jgi:deoxynucleoside triphosphate triphosphohydrolase SAMHD1
MVYDHRFEMFRAIYNHKTCQAIDLMYQDVLVKADPVFHFLDNLNNPKKYIYYTDLIISRIKKSKDPLLQESNQILDRVMKRNLY